VNCLGPNPCRGCRRGMACWMVWEQRRKGPLESRALGLGLTGTKRMREWRKVGNWSQSIEHSLCPLVSNIYKIFSLHWAKELPPPLTSLKYVHPTTAPVSRHRASPVRFQCCPVALQVSRNDNDWFICMGKPITEIARLYLLLPESSCRRFSKSPPSFFSFKKAFIPLSRSLLYCSRFIHNKRNGKCSGIKYFTHNIFQTVFFLNVLHGALFSADIIVIVYTASILRSLLYCPRAFGITTDWLIAPGFLSSFIHGKFLIH